MITWSIRVVIFIINSLLLTGFALMYWWLQHTQFQKPVRSKFRGLLQILLTVGFLVLFHFASELVIIQNHEMPGFGWNYLNFQMAVIVYSVFFSQDYGLFASLTVVLLIWYWWLPNTPQWFFFFVASVALMWFAKKYGRQMVDRPVLFYSFTFLFMVPFDWVNYISLRGIDVGWIWQIGTGFFINWLIWFIHHQLVSQSLRSAMLLHEAMTDTLTQLNNFRVFNEDLATAFKMYKKDGPQYLVYTFDIDHFKEVNDRFGHVEGNMVLREVAEQLQQIVYGISHHAKSYRVGGEEFAFIIFDRKWQRESSTAVANLIRKTLGEMVFTTKKGDQFQITISLGQDQVEAEDQNYLEAYRRADQKLYHSKQDGRNTVTVTQ